MKKKVWFMFVALLFFVLSSCRQSAEQMVEKARSIRNEEALRILNKAIEQYPNHAPAYALRARVKYNRLILSDTHPLTNPIQFTYFDYEPAIKDYTTAIRLEPNNYDFLMGRAALYEIAGKYNNAIKDYQKGLELDKESYFKKQGSYRQGQSNAAYILVLSNYLVENGRENDTEILGYLGTAYRGIGDIDNSIKILTQAITIEPNNGTSYLYRGDTHWANKNYQLAVNDYRRGKRLNPNSTFKTLEDQYAEIDPYNFKVNYIDSNRSNQVRQFKSTVTFDFNSGPDYFFRSLHGDTDLVLYSPERIDNLRRGQRVTVYFTHRPTTWDTIGKRNVLIGVVQ